MCYGEKMTEDDKAASSKADDQNRKVWTMAASAWQNCVVVESTGFAARIKRVRTATTIDGAHRRARPRQMAASDLDLDLAADHAEEGRAEGRGERARDLAPLSDDRTVHPPPIFRWPPGD